MNLTRDRLASIGWVTILVCIGALTAALMIRVNAVKSQVQLAERHIVALRREKAFLETELETRANQQQLTDINALYFGYKAPAAGQYFENERQLAALGKPRGPDAPAPILMASAEQTSAEPSGLPALVSPLTGKLVGTARAAEPDGEQAASGDIVGAAIASATVGQKLGRVRHHVATREDTE